MKFWVGSIARFGGQGILCCSITSPGIHCESVYTALADSTWLIKSRINNHLFSTGSGTDAFAFSGQITEFSVDGSNLVPVAAQSTKGNAHAIK